MNEPIPFLPVLRLRGTGREDGVMVASCLGGQIRRHADMLEGLARVANQPLTYAP